jgi:hypothetical protein
MFSGAGGMGPSSSFEQEPNTTNPKIAINPKKEWKVIFNFCIINIGLVK